MHRAKTKQPISAQHPPRRAGLAIRHSERRAPAHKLASPERMRYRVAGTCGPRVASSVMSRTAASNRAGRFASGSLDARTRLAPADDDAASSDRDTAGRVPENARTPRHIRRATTARDPLHAPQEGRRGIQQMARDLHAHGRVNQKERRGGRIRTLRTRRPVARRHTMPPGEQDGCLIRQSEPLGQRINVGSDQSGGGGGGGRDI